MPAQRISRLLRLISILQSGRVHSAASLSEELGVCRRTMFRDMQVLQSAGIPCYHDAEKGYQIRSGFFMPPVNLTIPETLGLLMLAKLAIPQRKRALMGPGLSAINKLAACVPESIRRACSDIMDGVSVNPGPQSQSEIENRHYAILQQCIDEGRTCAITYKSPVEPKPIQCELQPYLLHFSTRAWYAMGRTDLHDEVRIFKMQRFQQVTPVNKRFKKPRNFSAASLLGSAWQLIPEGKLYKVELEFTAKVATNVTEVLWHPSQEHTILPDGRCKMSFEVDGLGEIAWWVAGYADQVVVRKPDALRERVQSMLRSALKQYEDSEPAKRQKKKAQKRGQTLTTQSR